MTIVLGWPQVVMLLLMLVSIFIGIIHHGELRRRNGHMAVCDVLIIFTILYFGGFWS